MTSYEPKRPIERCPSHPGALLDDIIPATGKTKVEIANLLGISRQQLYDIIREKKPVSGCRRPSWKDVRRRRRDLAQDAGRLRCLAC